MKLSIITINYNNLEGLKRTYESVICQTWTDYEWIVIDGGSTDGSREFIEEHQDKFAYWCSEPDKGIYNAMNKGIAKARGEYLNFMNSGDSFYEETTLETVSHYLIKGKADVYYGNPLRFIEGRCDLEVIHTPLDIYDLYVSGLCHQASFLKKDSCFANCNYIETYKIVADYDKWLEIAFSGGIFEHMDVIVCIFDKTGISETEPELREKERIIAISKYYNNTIELAMKRLYTYEGGHMYNKVKRISERGGIKSYILRMFLKIIR